MRLIQNLPAAPKRRLVRFSTAAAVLIAALATSGCLASGGVASYQNNLSMGCRVTDGGVTICPGGRTVHQ